ncbi:RNA-binding ASCH domain-containing protein [Cinnamomum micranthum f. kanehirae]|uniref:RNA-binding ASCH domain-containing protein n=1 Tax=Cinnamomum micranthum f. kanehirae TaxID=337451 RepID=A0A3S5WGG8_9MAGN|nr:RNA-binding ASCH domain-containing protein [Cinnamomum micranthum f. kanehirae]
MSRGGNLRNPCLTMHQPWASLLVYGIKHIEGRSWPAPLRGRLWIHAAGKVPDSATIKAMEDFYREIYAVNGITDLKFPEHYPVVLRLLDVSNVKNWFVWMRCLKGWVRLEGQTDFCWLCEQPQIYEAAVSGFCPVECPLPVKFPLPDPSDPFSPRPGSLASYFSGSKGSENERSQSLNAAIAGARAAATQFLKKGRSNLKSDVQNLPSTSESKNNRVQEVDTKGQFGLPDGRFQRENRYKYVERKKSLMRDEANIIENNQSPNGDFNQKSGAPSKVVLYLINLWWPQNV